MRKPWFQRGEIEVDTYVEVGDDYYNDVKVLLEIERPEPDVNFGGGMVINGVWVGDRDLMLEMTEKELDLLAERLSEDFSGYGEDY